MIEPPRENISPFDYTRELVQHVRDDFNDRLEHESRYRKQYGQMAAEAMQALSTKGWVTLELSALRSDVTDMRKSQGRIFITAFALLISTLSLLLTVIFGLVTGGGS